MCLLMKYNPMGINKGLCSLYKIVSYKETQEILWLFSKIAISRIQELGCILSISLRQPFNNNSVEANIV